MIRLSSSRRFDMKSCLLHRVTKLAKLQPGPITVIDEIAEEQHFACASLESMQLALQKEEEEEKDRSLCAAFLFSFLFYDGRRSNLLSLFNQRLITYRIVAGCWV